MLPTPAGHRTFPTLSLQSLCRCLDPYPAVFLRCSYPLLPGGLRPHVTGNTFGTREDPCNATSPGSVFRGCNHSFIFRLPHSLGLQVAPTVAFTMPGGQAVYTTHRPGSYPTRDVVSLRVRHGQLTRLDSHQLDCSLVGCSFPHYALQNLLHSTASAFIRV